MYDRATFNESLIGAQARAGNLDKPVKPVTYGERLQVAQVDSATPHRRVTTSLAGDIIHMTLALMTARILKVWITKASKKRTELFSLVGQINPGPKSVLLATSLVVIKELVEFETAAIVSPSNVFPVWGKPAWNVVARSLE